MSESERIEWRALLTDAFAVSGMSERAVSEQARVNRGSLSEVLAGRSVPRAATIDALRRVFDLSGDIDQARHEVAERQARPGATPSIYWVPEPGSPEADEPVKWGHMEERFAELDARIARIEQAVIALADAADRNDPSTQNAYYLRRTRQHKAAIEASRRAGADFEAHLDGDIEYDDDADLPQALPLRRGMPGGAAPLAEAARKTNEEPGLKKARREHDEAAERIEDDRAGMEPS